MFSKEKLDDKEIKLQNFTINVTLTQAKHLSTKYIHNPFLYKY